MCGITGIYAYRENAPGVRRDELRAIRDHMRTRGPDGEGEWFSANGRIGFGHRRLSIIDLSTQAAQPMVAASGLQVLTYNGEIYNYRELRARLERVGHRFRSQSDTEVLLHLYAELGEAMLTELRGMFAFALWDGPREVLLLARDPYGIKPLYYADDGATLRFASQVKALRAGGRIADDPEPAGIVGFYLLGSVPEPFTLYREVRSLEAGSSLRVTPAGLGEPVRYFSPAATWRDAERIPPKAGDEIQDRVREALLNSVAHHLVADVPVGAFLSAGIDSGALVGLIRQASGQAPGLSARPGPANGGLSTVTLGFDEFEHTAADEAPIAARVAQAFGTRHTTYRVTEAEFHRDLPRILEAMDQPSIDGVNTWFVSKAAAAIGLKVAVSGVGGDELFGGYPSFRDIPRWVRMLRWPSRIPGLGNTAWRLFETFGPLASSLHPKAAGLLKYGGRVPGAYLLRRGLFLPDELPGVLDSGIAVEGLRRLQIERRIETAATPMPAGAFARVATLEASLYMRNQLLRDTDWASMAHSLEVRVPLVDAWLLRALAPWLARPGLGNRKHLLAKAPRPGLPDAVLARPKSGFSTPIATWLQRAETNAANRGRSLPAEATRTWTRHWAARVAEFGGYPPEARLRDGPASQRAAG